MTPADQSHLRILKILDAEPDISQRELAQRLGVSLGKTNYLLLALLAKGYIKAGNFLRARDKLKYAYVLSPEGLAAKLRLTRNYLARKEQEYEALRAEIETIRAGLEHKPCTPGQQGHEASEPGTVK
ncbi:MAG: MarR family EPS-associated transcriptional regulator [Saprospiraceae bacterium]|nr:MarR family EPS-associated transcriptional regulator [Saprospiraceae bacterium]MDW8485337.1 MarR family EPS-associated transcriptional regulator [Saprospiraceae bacterium]